MCTHVHRCVQREMQKYVFLCVCIQPSIRINLYMTRMCLCVHEHTYMILYIQIGFILSEICLVFVFAFRKTLPPCLSRFELLVPFQTPSKSGLPILIPTAALPSEFFEGTHLHLAEVVDSNSLHKTLSRGAGQAARESVHTGVRVKHLEEWI